MAVRRLRRSPSVQPRSAARFFSFIIFLIVNITGGQREGLPVGATGRRQGLKHHRSGECADERLAGG